MKKLILPLIFSLLFTLSACTSNSPNNGTKVNEGTSTGDVGGKESSEQKGAAEVSVEEQVLLDQDGIKVTLKSLENEGMLGPSLKVLVENNSSKAVTIQARNASINGVMMETIFSSDVAPGKKANENITFSSSDLEIASIETIKDIELSLHVFDPESFDAILDSKPIKITTSADPSFVQSYDDSGFVALEQNGFKIVIKKLDSENSFWGADIYVYIENNGDKNATVQIRDMSVNGFMIEPIFSSDVLAGKKAYDTITFMESDLTDNDIKDIKTLEFSFHIFETDNMNTILDSKTVNVSF